METSNSPLFLLAMDIYKAYDSVDRSALLAICEQIGLSANPLFRFVIRGAIQGLTVVKGNDGLFGGFHTSRGIK